MRIVCALALVAACSSSPDSGGGLDAANGSNGSGGGSGSGHGSGNGSGNALHSTLTSSCATLQGRAIVNENGNLGIAFTESDSPYTFLGSVQFELPAGFTGTIPNPENWDGASDRHVVAVSTPAFEEHGNHCWGSDAPAGGSVTVSDFRPDQGIVSATFTALPLHSCTTTSICTISGTITTTGEGVFD